MKRNKRFMMVVGLVLAVCFASTACSAVKDTTPPAVVEVSAAATTEAAPAGNSPKIAWICADLTAQCWADFEKGVNDKAKELGIDQPVAYNAQNDANEQLKQAQDCVTIGYDAVGLFANDSISCTAAVKELNKAGIPVVLIYVAPDDASATYNAFVDTEQVNGAYDSAKKVVDIYKQMGLKGTCAEMTISLARQPGALRKEGLQKALDEVGLKISYEKEAEKYTVEEAYNYVTDMMTAHDDISIVFANYDQAIQGAQKAVADAGKEGKVVIGGFDSSLETIDMIKAGKVGVTAAQPMYEQGKQMTQACVDLSKDPTKNLGKIMSNCIIVSKDSTDAEIAAVKKACYGLIPKL